MIRRRLCAILFGNPTEEEIKDAFIEGDWCEECYLVEAIEKFLQTEEQRKSLFDARLSIEKILNGSYTSQHDNLVSSIFDAWNSKLGQRVFFF